jgi:hypothetical protein
MNSSELESSRKKRKRSESSSDRSRYRSRSRDKKRKKDKKRKRSKSRSKDRRKDRKRDKKKKRERSKSKSRSSSEAEDKHSNKYQSYPQTIDPMMYYAGYKDPRMRMPVYYQPPYNPEYMNRAIRPHTPLPVIPPMKPIESLMPELTTEKIVKDQNFLNSDEKLFDSIINNEINIRSIFEDTQISESLAGTTLFRAIKKILYDPNTLIFDSTDSNKVPQPKLNEILKIALDENRLNIFSKNPLINPSDMKEVRDEIAAYKQRKIENK